MIRTGSFFHRGDPGVCAITLSRAAGDAVPTGGRSGRVLEAAELDDRVDELRIQGTGSPTPTWMASRGG
jgi:hypothetical protein